MTLAAQEFNFIDLLVGLGKAIFDPFRGASHASRGWCSEVLCSLGGCHRDALLLEERAEHMESFAFSS